MSRADDEGLQVGPGGPLVPGLRRLRDPRRRAELHARARARRARRSSSSPGIGCAARFPYYMQTYGMHSIHGRAPAIATGLAVSRPDLSVWVVSGDGDSLSIGGNHLIHALRRNVNIKILMFNNQIYGLTKGQYSPTSEQGKVTGSTPMGSVDYPFNPLSLALGAEATFVARAIDTDKPGLTNVLRRAAAHQGAAFVEIFQNCNIYNDGAFDFVRDDEGEPALSRARPAGGRDRHHARRDRLRDRVRALARHVRDARRRPARRLPRRRARELRRARAGAARQRRRASATCRRSSPPATPGRSARRATSRPDGRAGSARPSRRGRASRAR